MTRDGFTPTDRLIALVALAIISQPNPRKLLEFKLNSLIRSLKPCLISIRMNGMSENAFRRDLGQRRLNFASWPQLWTKPTSSFPSIETTSLCPVAIPRLEIWRSWEFAGTSAALLLGCKHPPCFPSKGKPESLLRRSRDAKPRILNPQPLSFTRLICTV